MTEKRQTSQGYIDPHFTTFRNETQPRTRVFAPQEQIPWVRG